MAALFERLEIQSPKEADVQPRIDAVFNKATNNELWQAATHGWSLHGEQFVDSPAWRSAESAAQQAVYLREAAQILQR